uniref:Serum albumin n=2 Tax=Petromyzon marinus TaxID=7757 RepID=A0AAJ7SIU6_PETMA|nr:serum albumin [Petromyzon marinus]
MGDCCGKENAAGCLLHHRYLFQDELCEGVSSIPSAASCCSLANEEDRADCLVSLRGNLSIHSVPLAPASQLCHDRRWKSHESFASLLWEFGRRHPRAADSQVEELAERFSKIGDACCDLADEKECITRGREAIHQEVSAAYADAAQLCSSLQALGAQKFLGR